MLNAEQWAAIAAQLTSEQRLKLLGAILASIDPPPTQHCENCILPISGQLTCKDADDACLRLNICKLRVNKSH